MPPESISTTESTAPAAPSEPSNPARKRKMILHTLAYVVGGGILGFGYHKLVGCRTGTCPITANPYISTIYGALMGFFVGGGLGR